MDSLPLGKQVILQSRKAREPKPFSSVTSSSHVNCTRSCTAFRQLLNAFAGSVSMWRVLLRKPRRRGGGCCRSVQKQSSMYMKLCFGFCMPCSSAILRALSKVKFIQNLEIVTIVDRPMGPESSWVWCLPAKVKLVDERHSCKSSMTSSTDSFVDEEKSASFSMVFFSSARQSLMGTLGKSAVAS